MNPKFEKKEIDWLFNSHSECIMTVEDWKANVESGAFIDYDGHGYLGSSDLESDIIIQPSDIYDDDELPDWCTHIYWYNK